MEVLRTIWDLFTDVGALIVLAIFCCLMFGDLAMLAVVVLFGLGNS
jgi:hypothetical protein